MTTRSFLRCLALAWLMAFCLHLKAAQEFLPAPPGDHGLIYVLDQQNQLESLPFEKAEAASSDRDRPEHKDQLHRAERRALGDGLAGKHANFSFHD